MGGGVPIAPEAEPDDGRLDVVIVPEMSPLSLLGTVPRILSGRHARTGRVAVLRWGDLQLVGEPGGCLNLDGEIVPWSGARFEILPRSLNVVAPGRERGGR